LTVTGVPFWLLTQAPSVSMTPVKAMDFILFPFAVRVTLGIRSTAANEFS
jgi:hypothetical protein